MRSKSKPLSRPKRFPIEFSVLDGDAWRQISPSAHSLYIVLCKARFQFAHKDKENWFGHTDRQMAAVTGMCVRTIVAARKELVAHSLIEYIKGKQNAASRYRILDGLNDNDPSCTSVKRKEKETPDLNSSAYEVPF